MSKSQLRMYWKDKPVPPMVLKDGCYVVDSATDKFTKDQLADGWTDACVELTEGRWTREQFYENMWNDPRIPDDGIFFAVTAEGRIFSTATAQIQNDGVGTLHMVGSSSDVRGKGGGRAVCTAVMEYFKKHGYKLVYLDTDDFRKPAVKIYLDLGFRPFLFEEDMEERWLALMEYYGIKELEAYDKDLNDVTLYVK